MNVPQNQMQAVGTRDDGDACRAFFDQKNDIYARGNAWKMIFP